MDRFRMYRDNQTQSESVHGVTCEGSVQISTYGLQALISTSLIQP